MKTKLILIILLFLVSSNTVISQTPYLINGFPRIIDTLRRPGWGKARVPLIADLNRDLTKEIIFTTFGPANPEIMIYVLNPDGTNFPGFPKGYNNESLLQDLASGDVNGDGYIDIVLRFQNKIDVIDRFGNSLTGFPVSSASGVNDHNFVNIYDLDGDGKLEIISSEIGKLIVFNHNGTIRNGFPVNTEDHIDMNPAVMDIDRDGYAEIIAFSYKHLNNPPHTSNGTLHCFKHDGSQAPGNWPVLYDSAYHEYYASPSVYYDPVKDSIFILFTAYRVVSPYPLDNSNRLDKFDSRGNLIIRRTFYPHIAEGTNLIVRDNNRFKYVNGKQTLRNFLHVFDEYLNTLPSWPQQAVSGAFTTACIGKLTYDNKNLILASWGTATGGVAKFKAYDMEGVEQSWSPLLVDGYIWSFALNDIDNDGSTELISISRKYEYDCRISIYRFPGVPFSLQTFSWPMYAHDRYKTNQYGFIPPDETVGIQPITNNIPNKFTLHQNYPNPFNPTTNIKFEIQKTSPTKLIIYDALGREVAILVNEVLKAGSYQTDWDGSNYTSGIYFYKLIANDFSETKKMLLIK